MTQMANAGPGGEGASELAPPPRGEGGVGATAPMRWWTLVRERFSPASYLPMAALFVLANGLFALAALASAHVAFGRFGAAYVLALSYFFRLRLFDEIKDYEVDLERNPHRPLARGLIGIGEVKRVIYALSAFELTLAAAFGWPVLLSHAIALGYSYLMYNEFFIGAWLRPRLTRYAVSHTVSSGLLGLAVAALVTGRGVWALPLAVWGLAAIDWALFNVFEFARKTYAPLEEPPAAETYSKRFGPRGAIALTLSQVVFALAVLAWLVRRGAAALPVSAWVIEALATLVVVAPALAYAWCPEPKRAAVFRAAAGLYIVAFLALLAVATWRAAGW